MPVAVTGRVPSAWMPWTSREESAAVSTVQRPPAGFSMTISVMSSASFLSAAKPGGLGPARCRAPVSNTWPDGPRTITCGGASAPLNAITVPGSPAGMSTGSGPACAALATDLPVYLTSPAELPWPPVGMRVDDRTPCAAEAFGTMSPITVSPESACLMTTL